MLDNHENQNSINKSNYSNERGNQYGMGLLDKLEALRNNKFCEELNIGFVKFSVEESISKFTDNFFNSINNKPTNQTSSNTKNIGLNFCIKNIQHPDNENGVLSLGFFDYNYNLSKKFKFLKNEAIVSSEVLILVINIFDKRALENFNKNFDELKLQINNRVLSNNLTNSFYKKKESNLICLLLKSTSNFLAKITEKQNLENLKLEISNLGIKNYIEIEDETLFDIECLINDIISYSK